MNTMHRLAQTLALSFLLSMSFASQATILDFGNPADEIALSSPSGDSNGTASQTDFDAGTQDVEISKTFEEVEELLFVAPLGGEIGDISFSELIENETGVDWTDYHLEVGIIDANSGARIPGGLPLGGGGFSITFDSLSNVNVGYTEMLSAGEESLWIFFDTPLEAGEDLVLDFTVNIDFGYDIGTEFYLIQHPSIATRPVPEPTSLALLGLGLAGFGVVRRRKS